MAFVPKKETGGRVDLVSGYTTKQVAELIGIKSDAVRHYVRRSLLHPARGERGEYRFSFQDVVLLRTAKGLIDAEVSIRKIYRSLLKLKSDLNQVQSLSSLKIFATGEVVLVQESDQLWEVESGQRQMEFDVEVPREEVAKIKAQDGLIKSPEALDTDEWYNVGLDLEEVDPERAPEAYRQAIKLDPRNADAHVNLGRLYQLDGQLKYAKRHYQMALDSRPEHQLANYNMGTIFDELDELTQASDYYERAPEVPDAHYNLARIKEIEGDEISAQRHMKEYQLLIDEEV